MKDYGVLPEKDDDSSGRYVPISLLQELVMASDIGFSHMAHGKLCKKPIPFEEPEKDLAPHD